MDMFYNNPIRTFFVLLCLFFSVVGTVSAQSKLYRVTITKAVNNGACVDNATAPNLIDLGLQLKYYSTTGYAATATVGGVAGSATGAAGTSGLGGAPTAPAAAAALKDIAVGAAGVGPFPVVTDIALCTNGTISATTFEDDTDAVTDDPNAVFNSTVDVVDKTVNLNLPTGGVNSNATTTITGTCFTVTVLVEVTKDVPVPVLKPVTLCASGAILVEMIANGNDAKLGDYHTALNAAAAGPYDLVMLMDNNNNTLLSVGTIPAGALRDAIGGLKAPADAGTYTYNLVYKSSKNPDVCPQTIPLTLNVRSAVATFGASTPASVVACTVVDATGFTLTTKVQVPTYTDMYPVANTSATATNATAGAIAVSGPVSINATTDEYTLSIPVSAITAYPATVTVNVLAAAFVNSCAAPISKTFTFTKDSGAALSCNRFINLSLGSGCSATLTPAMVLNGNGATFNNDLSGYTITLLDLAGNQIGASGNSVTVKGMGSYKYEITSPCGDKCWGDIDAKDKVAPVCTAGVAVPSVACSVPMNGIEPIAAPTTLPNDNPLWVYFAAGTGTANVGTPITAKDDATGIVTKTSGTGKVNEGIYTFSKNNRSSIQVVVRQNGTDYIVAAITDGCGIAQIGYTDNVVENCDATGTVRTVTRSYFAVDVNGNRSALSCTTVFKFTKPVTTAANILLPGEGGNILPIDAAGTSFAGAFTKGAFSMIACDRPDALLDAKPLNTELVIGTDKFYYTTGVPVVNDGGKLLPVPSAREGAAGADAFGRMCMITSSYKDEFIPGCTASVGKIVRKWTVIDMCTKVTKTGTQIITVMSPTPTFSITNEDKSCGSQATNGTADNKQTTLPVRSVNTDAGECSSTATLLNIDISGQKCGTTVTDAVVNITKRRENWGCAGYDAMRGVAFPIALRGLDAKIPALPAGEYEADVYVTNNCGVSSTPQSFILRITDREAPTAISVDQLVVGLTNNSNGSTRIYASQLDKGSRDNCGVASIQVGLSADGPFSEYVNVSCSNAPMVFLRVTDCAKGREIADANGNNTRCETVSIGNTNTVMVPITIQDKSAPQCSAPGDMVMYCEQWLELKKVVGSGAAAAGSNNPAVVERLRSMGGSFTSISSCSGVINETYAINVNSCGEGSVVRTYVISKPGVPDAKCTQTIVFRSNKPQSFFANFPKDVNKQDCSVDPSTTGSPEITDSNGCENVQVTYSDEVFVNKGIDPLNPGANKSCKKIIRTWKVINMCIYNPTRNNALPEGDFDCVLERTSVSLNAEGDVVLRDINNISGLSGNIVSARGAGTPLSGYVRKKDVICNADYSTPNAFITNVYLNNGVDYVATAANGFTTYVTGLDNQVNAAPFASPGLSAAALTAINTSCEKIYFNYAQSGACNPAPLTSAPFGLRGNVLWLDRTADGRVRARDRAGDGVVRYVQVINIEDTTTPVFTTTCPKPEVTTTVNPTTVDGCRGNITLTNSATDNCGGDVTVDVTVVSADRDFVKDGADVTSIFVGSGKGSYTGTVNVPLNKALTVIWSATDICGNVATCSYKINVPDTKAPIVVCRDLSSELMALGTNSMLALTVDKFVVMGQDNCTPMDKLIFSFDAAGKETTKVFTCADVKASLVVPVKIYVTDAAGNTNFCNTNAFFRPEDKTACGFNGTTASVAGLIKNESSEGVEKVTVKLNADAGVTAIETAADGKFNYNLPLNKDYSVNPAKTTGLLNGVSTYDLVLIQKHILDVEKLNSSYKVVAADVNKDGKVTTLDIVELRKAILRISSNFPNGQNSWRFVHKDYAFASTEGAAGETFPETFNINNLKAQQKADFVGVKVGDVNESAAPNSLIGAEERGSRKAFVMTAEDRIVKAGEEVSMNVVADAANVAGFQYTLNFDKNALEFAGVKAGAINVTDANVAVLEGAITTSWNGEATNGNLFTVTFRAKTDGRLSELVNVNSRYTEAEAYTKQAETMNVELRFNGTAANGFALFQNQPNPFTKETIIGFNLPTAQAATLKVYDVTGKAIKMVNADYAKGYNEVKIADLKATGVLYYTLETQGFTATKKMVIVE